MEGGTPGEQTSAVGDGSVQSRSKGSCWFREEEALALRERTA